MIITRFESWWVERGKCLFDERRQGGAKMGWDVIVIKLTTDTGVEGIATCMAARSGAVSESYLQESIAPVVLGRDPHDREAIFQELWVIDRHEAFFPVFLPGPVDVALWDICAKEAGLPLYKYIGAYRSSLPHPAGPVEFDMKVHAAVREAVGGDLVLMTDPVGDYTLDEAIRVGRQLEKLDYKWFEEPFRDFELYKYTELCRTLDIPIAATETTRGCHWGVAQVIAQRAADIVRADVSWKDGITGTLKIAHMAEGFGLNCEIHTTTMNYMDMANLHVSCAIKNCEYFEYFVPEDNYRFPMKGDLPIDENGIIHVPDKPGVGAELDWDLIQSACHNYICQEYGK